MSGSPMHGPWQRGPLAEKALQRAPVHAQALRGMGDVAVALLEDAHHMLPTNALEAERHGRDRR